MPTDPFVAADLDDAPRQQQNLAPGFAHAAGARLARRPPRRPRARASRRARCSVARARTSATRYTLAKRVRDRLAARSRTSTADDAVAVVAEIAMKRAAHVRPGAGRSTTSTSRWSCSATSAMRPRTSASGGPTSCGRRRTTTRSGARSSTRSHRTVRLPISELPEHLAIVRGDARVARKRRSGRGRRRGGSSRARGRGRPTVAEPHRLQPTSAALHAPRRVRGVPRGRSGASPRPHRAERRRAPTSGRSSRGRACTPSATPGFRLAVPRGVRRPRRRHPRPRDPRRGGGAGVRVVVAVRVHLEARR